MFHLARGQAVGDEVKLQRVGAAINERDAEDHDRRGRRAEDEIFDARLQRAQPVALQTGEHVKRNRDEFDRDE